MYTIKPGAIQPSIIQLGKIQPGAIQPGAIQLRLPDEQSDDAVHLLRVVVPAQDTQEIVGGGPAEHVGFVIILQECVEFRLPHGYVQVADEVFSVSIRDRSGPQALWKAVRRNVNCYPSRGQ